jgi:hypothetical protein
MIVRPTQLRFTLLDGHDGGVDSQGNRSPDDGIQGTICHEFWRLALRNLLSRHPNVPAARIECGIRLVNVSGIRCIVPSARM